MRLIDADRLRDWLDTVELTEDGGVDINDMEEYLTTAPMILAVPRRHIERISRGGLLEKLLAEFPADDKTASRIIEIIENMPEENTHNDT